MSKKAAEKTKKSINWWKWICLLMFVAWLGSDRDPKPLQSSIEVSQHSDQSKSMGASKPREVSALTEQSKPVRATRESASKPIALPQDGAPSSSAPQHKVAPRSEPLTVVPDATVSDEVSNLAPALTSQPVNQQEQPTPLAAPEPARMYVDASKLNVRNGPGKTFKVVWTVKRDEEVFVVASEGKWKNIRNERYNGWVFGSYLTKYPSTSDQEEKLKTTKAAKPTLTDRAVRKILIERSLAYYPGNCPCPYNRDRAGRKCGKRSAYSRPGGEEPLCYLGDVTAGMVEDYRARN